MLKLRKRRFYLAVFPHHFVRFAASQELIHFNGLGGSHLAWLCLAPAAAGFSPWDEARTLSLTPNFTYRAALRMGVAGRMPFGGIASGRSVSVLSAPRAIFRDIPLLRAGNATRRGRLNPRIGVGTPGPNSARGLLRLNTRAPPARVFLDLGSA
jgi:hypothetical protein